MIYPTLTAALQDAITKGFDAISLSQAAIDDPGGYALHLAEILVADPVEILVGAEPEGVFTAYSVHDGHLFDAQGLRIGTLFNTQESQVLSTVFGPVAGYFDRATRRLYADMYAPYATELGEHLAPERDAVIQAANDASGLPEGDLLSLNLPSRVVRATLDNQEHRLRLDLEKVAHWRQQWQLDATAGQESAWEKGSR
ncbi:hypothetical protein [Deinococcus sp. 12RED42]|uniref:hypothetical protein n=1 Tax=Deinococcus sp. 12RED42 TaxID=2745872 RepID=UPI001E4920B6|nr:hypothetical protein [Deinococcus sp. 12RED42]MCD0164988.1 hypothetical protein [Deinococcus sp. 12RED42]